MLKTHVCVHVVCVCVWRVHTLVPMCGECVSVHACVVCLVCVCMCAHLCVFTVCVCVYPCVHERALALTMPLAPICHDTLHPSGINVKVRMQVLTIGNITGC